MNAFSNVNIKDKLCGDCACTGFAPTATFAYDAGAGTITVTNATTYPAGDSAKQMLVKAIDKDAGQVVGNSTSATGVVTLDVSGLNNAEGFTVLVTVETTKQCISDGHAKWIGIAITEGSVSFWDKDNDALTV